MKINKLMTKLFVASAAVALPAVTLTGCSADKIKTPWNTANITSTFYNSYDMLVSLGVTPNAQQIASSALNYDIYPYMESISNKDETNFGTFIDMNNVLPVTNSLYDVQTDTVVLNEWDKAKESQWLSSGVLNAVAYTSMGDTIGAKYTYTENELGTDWNNATPWHQYKEGMFSYRKALLMLAKDLDSRFNVDNKTLQGNDVTTKTYVDRANQIIDKDKEQIQQLRTTLESSSLNGKTIGIINGGSSKYDNKPELKSIYDPFIYPEIYGPEGIGMGVSFPTPENNENAILYAEDGGSLAYISSQDPAVLKEGFKNKFDKLIFVRPINTDKDGVNAQLEQVKSLLKTETSSLALAENETIDNTKTTPNKTTSNDVVVVNYQDWYPTTWGVYGKTHMLKNFIECLNIFESAATPSTKQVNFEFKTDLAWQQYKPEELVKPTKK